jgi:uncharacterized membrane protein
MSSRSLLAVALVAALIGFGFAAASTFDFSAHLDRQVHSLHCSFIPGLKGSDAGAQGCQVTLMSPYSSIFRSSVWGGIPISLPAMALFAAIAAVAALILLTRSEEQKSASTTLLLLALGPVGASLVMGSIAAFELGAACKQCIGIYISSFALGVSAFLAWRKRGVRVVGAPDESSSRSFLIALPLAGVLVILPMAGYVLAMPKYSSFQKGCGELAHPEDRHNVLLRITGKAAGGSKPAIEVFDPLCPACKAFEDRLHAAGLDEQMQRDLLLFPLDNTCNWMIDNAMHPGACAVSGAVLCAGDRAKEVIDWAFAEQAKILAAAKTDATAAERMTAERFPDLKTCMTSAVTKQRITQSLRWAVRNQIPVLTPQLYVDGKRLCDEDTDLGLEYTLTRMLKGEP